MGVVGPAKKSYSKIESDIEDELRVAKMMTFSAKSFD